MKLPLHSRRKMLLTAAITAAMFAGGEHGSAIANVAAEEFSLDQIIVTATRYEKHDLDIAAATEVLTAEKLKSTGARNVQQALSKVHGLVYQSKGPGGASLGSMTSKVSIRGVEKGTLVLVNGTPINWRGLYNLEDIPIDNIESIEIVRGGGSVLYGSEATGGVINIITKKAAGNTVKAGIGNRGQQNYGFTVQEDKFGIAYNYDKWGDLGKVSSTFNDASKPGDKEMYNQFRGSEKNDVMLSYQFSDDVNLIYNHGESVGYYEYTFGEGYADSIQGKARYDRKHERKKDFVQLNFKDGDVKGNIYYNRNALASRGLDYYKSSGSKNKQATLKDDEEKNLTYGYDVQKVWDIKSGKFLVGTTFQREAYSDRSYNNTSKLVEREEYSRNNFSVYGQWETDINKSDTLLLSARETWTTGADEDKNYNNFSGQAQYIHKLDDNSSLYGSVGQSFAMPSFSNMYATGAGIVVGDPNLSPQKGTHYEIGWKKNHDDHKYRVAVFNYKIKDNISFSKSGDKYYAMNEDLKNTGVELSVDIGGDTGWSYSYGVTYSDPKSRSKSAKVGTKDYWDRAFGRWQLNTGVNYRETKFSASLTANYLAERVLTPSSAHSVDTKPYLLTTLNLNYAPDAVSEFNLSIDNVLDRQDNVNHTTSSYYAAPINFLLSYKYKF